MWFFLFFSYLDLFGYTVLYAVFGFADFVCGFAVLDEFFFGFAVSIIPQRPPHLQDQFTVLKKCRTKLTFDCLIYEMLFIRNIKPKINTQSDSVRAKRFKITIEYFNTLFNSLHIFTNTTTIYTISQFYHVL